MKKETVYWKESQVVVLRNQIIMPLSLISLEDSLVNNLKEKKSFQWRHADGSLKEFKKGTKGFSLDCRNKDFDEIYKTWDDKVKNLMTNCFDNKFKQCTKDQTPKCKDHKQLQMIKDT